MILFINLKDIRTNGPEKCIPYSDSNLCPKPYITVGITSTIGPRSVVRIKYRGLEISSRPLIVNGEVVNLTIDDLQKAMHKIDRMYLPQ